MYVYGLFISPSDAGTDISNYKNLRIWAKVTGDKKATNLSLQLKGSDTKAVAKGDMLKFCPSLFDGKWHEVVIPIKDLEGIKEMSKAKAWEIQFDIWSQDAMNFSLFVDEIAFDDTAAPAAASPQTKPDAPKL